MHDTIPEPPCRDCPWRLVSPRFAWPIERFNDLRLERLTSKKSNALPPCFCPSGHNKMCELSAVEMRPVTTTFALGSSGSLNEAFFLSFEAMADANGAGLYDWTAQLNGGDLVVHFLCGVAVEVLEVTGVRSGIVQASDKNMNYRFNTLGYEMKCTSDSRILPATRATLETFVLQPDPNESHNIL